ncbi:hypothetical protein [Streptomyces sp. NPDC005407]|uniref:hypothetical protein n=1 Tax=Streptomyces sp. NPDC005407 TaxID=3155340 RepID=UPI0033BE58F2
MVVHTELLEDNAVGLMPHRRGGSVGKEALQHMPKGAEDRRELPPGNSRPRSHGLKQKHPTTNDHSSSVFRRSPEPMPRRSRWRVATAVATASLIAAVPLVVAEPAFAQYPPAPGVVIDDATVAPGDPIDFTATGFQPAEPS